MKNKIIVTYIWRILKINIKQKLKNIIKYFAACNLTYPLNTYLGGIKTTEKK